MTTDKQIFDAACAAWHEAATLRHKRQRYKRFTYGDQWSDRVIDGNQLMTAADRARAHGRRPMTNNLLRRLVKSVIGRYRYMRQEQQPLDGDMARLYTLNNLDEIDCRSLEEFLISGCVIQRVCRERRLMGLDTWVDIVSPERFFINHISDPRGWDSELVGMLHDWSLNETLIRLGADDYNRRRLISQVYDHAPCPHTVLHIGDSATDTLSFTDTRPGRCRVIEVWTLEADERLRCHDPARATMFTLPIDTACRLDNINRMRSQRNVPPIDWRWDLVTRWRCRWFAPDGTLLLSHTSHAPDGGHPFRFKFYPMIDGEVHSLVEDVIDQQIYINELISLIDHVVSCAAKGVLLFPADEKLPGMSWQEVSDTWSTPDGVIPIKGRNTNPPHQVMTQSSNLGARELLATQMQMFEDVSGVSNALMGRDTSANSGVEHYESRVKNAIIAIADILDTYSNFIAERNRTLLPPSGR